MTNATARADAGRPGWPDVPPEGFRYVAVAENPDEWKPSDTKPDGSPRTCRWRGSNDRKACGKTAVVRLYRGVRRLIWWNYCPEHAYGRWAEDGVVLSWRLEPAEVPS